MSRLQILGIDPGDMTGWSLVEDPGGHEIAHGMEHYNAMPVWLEQCIAWCGPIHTVIVEDFALFKNKALAQAGSKLYAPRVIGMIEYWAHLNQVGLVFQPPSIKPIAQKFTQRKPTGAHSKSHDIDAYNHAIYWLTKQGRYEVDAGLSEGS
jgi:hypothetical protein